MSQNNFIEFLIENDALKFGEFTLKSGRISPYFFNLGVFNTGKSLEQLGRFYAETLLKSNIEYDVLFGPAYKGIPLVSTTSIALYNHHQINTPYCFNRKETKDHGDAGTLVGAQLKGNIVMFDDVITAGTTVHETLELMKHHNAKLSGIIIAFDRQERGTGNKSAVQEVTESHGTPVHSIIKLEDILNYLENKNEHSSTYKDILNYKDKWGVKIKSQDEL